MARTSVTLVKPVTCTRCKGEGYVEARREHLGISGLCFQCDGRKQVEGDQATIAARKAEEKVRTERQMAYLLWEQRHRLARTPESDTILEGAWALMHREPERFQKLKDSLYAGRTDIEPALIAYAQQANEELRKERLARG